MKATLNALKAEWDVTVDPDPVPDPDTPEETKGTVDGENAVYALTEAKQFLPANTEYIDTGVKLFEDISAQPTWTLLIDANDFGRQKSMTVSPVMFQCSDGSGPYFNVATWLNGACMFHLYGYETRLGWWGGSTAAHWNAYVQIKGTQFRMGSDPANDAWQDIPSYSGNITASLILGACKSDDGTTFTRYWDGTIKRFEIYNKELTNDQISKWLNG